MLQIPWFKDTFTGIYVHFNQDGLFDLCAMKCKNKGQDIVVLDFRHFEDLSDLGRFCGSIPSILIFNGSGTIIKNTETKQIEGSDFFAKLLPNANLDNFLFQIFDHRNSHGFKVSITRKEAVDNVLLKLNAGGVVVDKVICGVPYVNEKIEEPLIGDNIEVNGIKDQELATKFFRDLYSVLLNEKSTEWKYTKINTSAYREHFYENRFFKLTRLLLLLIPTLILVVLVANMFIYEKLESEFVDLNSIISQQKGQLDSIAQLEDQVKQRSMVTGNMDGVGSIPMAYFADQIGQSVPDQISLSELSICPTRRDDITGEVVTFQFDTLTIRGNTMSGRFLNDWIKDMKNMNWVKNITIQNFQQPSVADQGIFDLILTTK